MIKYEQYLTNTLVNVGEIQENRKQLNIKSYLSCLVSSQCLDKNILGILACVQAKQKVKKSPSC